MNDKSTKEMKVVRDYIREMVRRIKNDPYLLDIDVKNRLLVRIVKWDKRTRGVLICVRDLKGQETMWDSHTTRWFWVHTYSHFWKYNIWREVNNIACYMQYSDKLPF